MAWHWQDIVLFNDNYLPDTYIYVLGHEQLTHRDAYMRQ